MKKIYINNKHIGWEINAKEEKDGGLKAIQELKKELEKHGLLKKYK